MNIRFRDKFDTIIDVTAEMMEMKIIKMTLQPLVENAIYHGLEQKEGTGKLIIKGDIDNDRIIFEVKDNGQGMTEKELSNLRMDLRNARNKDIHTHYKRSIGLVNIHRRIKLFSGEDYGLNIYSKKKEGTKVKVILPADCS